MIKDLESQITLPSLVRLAPSLDTVQCLLLVVFGLRSSQLKYSMVAIYNRMATLLPLLGLNVRCSAGCLESRLALHAACIGVYSSCGGSDISSLNSIWFQCSATYSPCKFSNVYCTFDKIHFVTSQCMFNGYLAVYAASRDRRIHATKKIPGTQFAQKIRNLLGTLQANFQQSWHILGRITEDSHNKTLLRQSKLMILVYYLNDFIRLADVSSYINPKNPSAPVSDKPNTGVATHLIISGLESAMTLIQLVSLVTSPLFNIKQVRLLVLSYSFISAHYDSTVEASCLKSSLTSSLSLAHSLLTRLSQFDQFCEDAEISLLLSKYFTGCQGISVR
ncbi:hypothetical protein DSO57_1015386 [Entomophthora muscae]|uniref:Uncharacterized protein n=1 Tax=Entomophthora muscae TaxID=34485 RepID=A0ACC2RW95_9FUNG|nr:hypothetical protein DSO57_1015386 [Entomophthora muscae]